MPRYNVIALAMAACAFVCSVQAAEFYPASTAANAAKVASVVDSSSSTLALSSSPASRYFQTIDDDYDDYDDRYDDDLYDRYDDDRYDDDSYDDDRYDDDYFSHRGYGHGQGRGYHHNGLEPSNGVPNRRYYHRHNPNCPYDYPYANSAMEMSIDSSSVLASNDLSSVLKDTNTQTTTGSFGASPSIRS